MEKLFAFAIYFIPPFLKKRIKPDKQKHLVGCFGISASLTAVLMLITRKRWLSAIIGAGIPFVAVTLYKEIWRDLIRKKGVFDPKDILANFIGSVSGAMLVLGLVEFTWPD